MRNIIILILRILTQRVLRRYQPTIIGVTGSVGKTTTKDAIYTVLKQRFSVAKSMDNINNEIGVPCAVLGITPAGTHEHHATIGTRIKFLGGLLNACWIAYGPKKKNFPRIYVLELGADKPGDMQYLAAMLRPQVAVVTAVGSVPVHVEYYPGPEAVAREKSRILSFIRERGLAVLNADDPIVARMKSDVAGPVKTFGLQKDRDLWASDVSYYINEDQIEGLSFKLHRGKEVFLPVKLPGFIGAHQVYAVLAATAVGLYFEMNLLEIVGAFELLEVPDKRMMILRGTEKTMIIDDTYNASPLSMKAALEALREFGQTMRKLNPQIPHKTIAVIGDMKELGQFSEAEHKKIGEVAAKNANYLITLGAMAKRAADHAKESMEADHVFSFLSASEAALKIQEIKERGDIILVKGSRAMKMEQIVDALAEKS